MAARMGPAQTSGAAAGRGLALVAIAVVIGVLLLRQVDSGTASVSAEGEGATETTVADGGTGDGTPTETSVAAPTDTLVPQDTTVAEATTTTVLSIEERPHNEVKVLVANAKTGVSGAAGRLAEQVAAFGYIMGDPTNTTDLALDVSVIQYQPGYAAEANRLATELGWPVDPTVVQPASEPSPVESLDGANLLVLLGVDRAS